MKHWHQKAPKDLEFKAIYLVNFPPITKYMTAGYPADTGSNHSFCFLCKMMHLRIFLQYSINSHFFEICIFPLPKMIDWTITGESIITELFIDFSK